MSKAKYQHNISCNNDEEERLQSILTHGYGTKQIFRMGMEEAMREIESRPLTVPHNMRMY